MRTFFDKTLPLIIYINTLSVLRQDYHDDLALRNDWDDEYDFIIVGAGSGGCTIGNRLSEEESFKILLLEAGGAQSVQSDMPAQANSLRGGSLDWNFTTTPQKYSNSFYEQRISIHRGKVLGGSSVLNNMNYVRGMPSDFERLAEHTGDQSWGFQNVLKYYKKAERNTDPLLKHNVRHSFSGAQTISSSPRNKLHDTFISATIEYGFPSIYDVNSDDSDIGTAYMQKNIKDGIRQSASIVYLQPIYKKRPNLHILAHSFVTQILFRSHHGKYIADGVKFYRNGQYHTVKATKEVIITAGTFNTGKLLMLSGIGPAEHLQEHGINVIADLPVGKSLYDIVAVENGFEFSVNQKFSHTNYTLEEYKDWFDHGTGALSQLTITSFRGRDMFNNYFYLRIQPGSKSDHSPDKVAKEDNFRKDYWEKYYKNYAGQNTINALAVVQYPFSKGSLELKSNHPFDYPNINPGYLTDERDVRNLVHIARLIYKFVYETKAFQKFQPKRFNVSFPGCEQYFDKDQYIPNDDYLECVIKSSATTFFDPVAVAQMGRDHDDSAVVDSGLLVKKVTNLRICDASVIPFTNAGYTHNNVIMIAEKISDVIKNTWKNI